MKKEFVLSIDKPCQEKWDNMKPFGNQMYCAVCQRNLHDFTHMSNAQIAKILAKDNKACGKILPSQLNKKLIYRTNSKTHQIFKKWAASVLLISSSSMAFSKVDLKFNPIEILRNVDENRQLPPKNILELKIYTSDGYPAYHIPISIPKFNILKYTNKNGVVKIDLSDVNWSEEHLIEIVLNTNNENKEYSTMKINVYKEDMNQTKSQILDYINLKSEPFIMGKMILKKDSNN